MESTSYLTSSDIDYSDSKNVQISSTCSMFNFDATYALVKSEPLMPIQSHSFPEIAINTSGLIKREPITMKIVPERPVIVVDGRGSIEPLIRSIEKVAMRTETICIQLKTDHSSIKLLRKALKAVALNQKMSDKQRDDMYKWRSKANTFMQSIDEYNEADYLTSTGESGSEVEAKVRKKSRKCKKVKQGICMEQDNDEEERESPNVLMRCRYPMCRGKNMWIYCGNFFRNGRLVNDEIPNNFSPTNRSQLYRRIGASKNIKPDPKVFDHVAHEIPWEEADWGPLLDRQLSQKTINRVLKGISLGRLYNIDYSRLSQIFSPLLSESEQGFICPLCGKNFHSNKSHVMNHMESIHTNFIGFCGKCGHLIVRSDSWQKHKTKCPKREKSYTHFK